MYATAQQITIEPVRPVAFARLPDRWTQAPVDPVERLQGGACSHVGLRREHNEDQLLTRPDVGLFAVCDGVGGHAAGEIASLRMVETLGAMLDQPYERSELAWHLRDAIEQANQQILEEGLAQPERRGMATTVVALWFDGARAFFAHVGDSRIYRVRDGELKRLTLDHSLVGDAVRQGLITRELADSQPPSPVITRCVGTRKRIVVELGISQVRVGDRFILCSDGLSDMVPDAQLKHIVQADSGAQSTRQLVLAALDAGGYDNVTVVVVDVG